MLNSGKNFKLNTLSSLRKRLIDWLIDLNDTTMHKATNMTNRPIWIYSWLIKRCVEAHFTPCSPSFVHDNSKNCSIKLTKTRGSNTGQRCVGVCGSCQFATFPMLSAALVASKGSSRPPDAPNISHHLALHSSGSDFKVRSSHWVYLT